MLLCGNRTSGSRLRGELIGVSLVLDGVSKELEGEVHVADVSLTLSKGSLNVLLGATLAGKTSLMRLMAGLHQPSKGRVIMDGRDVTGWPRPSRPLRLRQDHPSEHHIRPSLGASTNPKRRLSKRFRPITITMI